MGFTAEELAEMRRADEDIDRDFALTREDLALSRDIDKIARLDSLDNWSRKLAERQRAYREANRDKVAERQRAYYEANRDKVAEYHRAYFEANRDKLHEAGAVLRDVRKSRGYTQRDLAGILGVTQQTISYWETGAVPIDVKKLEEVFPGFRSMTVSVLQEFEEDDHEHQTCGKCVGQHGPA